MRWSVFVLSILLVVGTAAPVAGVGGSQEQSDGYDGTHVSFDTTGTAVVDYAVDGATVMESIEVQSQHDVEDSGVISIGADLAAVTGIVGADLSLDASATTATGATLTAESGAEIRAHDNDRGILVVDAGDESQYVTVGVGADARSEGDDRVVVGGGNGTGAFVVVGDGGVTVNDDGNVTADLASDAKLVYRSYADGRDDDDERQERLISEGKAAAEVYVMRDDGETVADTVRYNQDTTVDVTQKSEGSVQMTAERTTSEGTIILTSVSKDVVDAAGDLNVTVDGEAAARASSYSDLESAASGGDTSKFLVRQTTSADASVDVLVAVDHFSTRSIEIRDERTGDDDGSDGGDGSGDDATDGGSSPLPGFGPLATVTALAALLIVGIRHR